MIPARLLPIVLGMGLAAPCIGLAQAPEPRPRQTREQIHNQKEEQAKRSFARSRALLRAKRVPFDPDELLKPRWRENLGPTLRRMKEMQRDRYLISGRLGGVQFAKNLVLAEKTRVDRDLVIVADSITFEGKEAVLYAPGRSVSLFLLKGIRHTERPGHRKTRKAPVTYIIVGSPTEEERRIAGSAAFEESPVRWASLGTPFQPPPRFGPPQSEYKDGQDAYDGVTGDPGDPGAPSGPGTIGSPGQCDGIRNGGDGGEGKPGGEAKGGGRGTDGEPGGEGGEITAVFRWEDSGTFVLSARGGRGGEGGAGGPGGQGGPGGDGGEGGPGANCSSGSAPNGGTGGVGGKGGKGGNGGPGGTGKNGGKGGIVNYWNCPNNPRVRLRIYVDGGAAGPGGLPGIPGDGGSPGAGGRGGARGRVAEQGKLPVYGERGKDGATGEPGDPGSPGTPGTAGEPGAYGTVNDRTNVETECPRGGPLPPPEICDPGGIWEEECEWRGRDWQWNPDDCHCDHVYVWESNPPPPSCPADHVHDASCGGTDSCGHVVGSNTDCGCPGDNHVHSGSCGSVDACDHSFGASTDCGCADAPIVYDTCSEWRCDTAWQWVEDWCSACNYVCDKCSDCGEVCDGDGNCWTECSEYDCNCRDECSSYVCGGHWESYQTNCGWAEYQCNPHQCVP